MFCNIDNKNPNGKALTLQARDGCHAGRCLRLNTTRQSLRRSLMTSAIEPDRSRTARPRRVRSWRMATHSTTAAEGSEAPRFELPDAQGAAVSLDELLGRGPVVLVFLRGFA